MLKSSSQKKFNHVYIDGQKNCRDDLIFLHILSQYKYNCYQQALIIEA